MQALYLPFRIMYGKSKAGSTSRMNDIYSIRRANLTLLLKEQFDSTQAKLAALMDCEASLVSRLLTGRQNIGTRMARSIETKVGRPENWMDSPQLSGQSSLAQQMTGKYNVVDGPPLQMAVPLISWVQAGQWEAVIDNLHAGDAEKWIHTTAHVGPHAYALRVVGDSMTNPSGAPSFPEGTIIILDPERPSDTGKFVVVRQKQGEECTFKQLVRDAGRWYLKPLNPRYPLLELADDAAVVGVLAQAILEF